MRKYVINIDDINTDINEELATKKVQVTPLTIPQLALSRIVHNSKSATALLPGLTLGVPVSLQKTKPYGIELPKL